MHALIFAFLVAVLPPCQTEDSSNCHWNAATRGDGIGRSFVDLGGYLIFAPSWEG